MLPFAILATVTTAARLHAVPLPLRAAHLTLCQWAETVAEPRRAEVARSRDLYGDLCRMGPSTRLGVVAIADDEDARPRALGLFERIGDGRGGRHVYLWDVACVDDSSGTLLVKAMQRSGAVRMSSPSLDARWKVAAAFWSRVE